MKIYIEYENNKLKDISNSLYQLFKNNNYNVELLDNSLSLDDKIRIIENNTNSLTISNKINEENNIEIVYPLRKKDTLAKELANNLSNIVTVNKYYQLRSTINTSKDYYDILRDINDNSIVIKYGNNVLNNKEIPVIIYQTINSMINNNKYTVVSGDSLYSIARKFNTTVDNIKKANNLTSNLLNIGQQLIIPSNTNNSGNNSNNNNNSNNYYNVVSGDSLYSIARRFNTTVDDIKKANNLTSNLLSIGQQLIIPNSNSITYTVIKGDSLYSIARKYNTTVDELKRINNLSNNLLSIGQKLIIK